MAAVKTADSAGASKEPQAALHLKLAKEQIGQAQQMIEEGDFEEADRMTMRANEDAELALGMAREARLKRDLQAFASAHPELTTPATAPGTPSTAPSAPSGAAPAQPMTPGK
jgi:hypothetical protein